MKKSFTYCISLQVKAVVGKGKIGEQKFLPSVLNLSLTDYLTDGKNLSSFCSCIDYI